MRVKKTIKVEMIKAIGNEFLLNSGDDVREMREGIAVMISTILHKTGNYKGFAYLYSNDMQESENGTTIGINDDLTFSNTDNTRIRYY